MATYGGTTFVAIMALQLRFRTDELVLGSMMTTVAITYFNIGARIVDYAQDFLSSMAQIFVPMASQSEATGDAGRLRKLYIAGNRACALTIFPVALILLILGKDIIRIWVGAQYVPHSYPVLVVMMIPFVLTMMQGASTRILYGLGNHRTYAVVTLIEGVANLILSIALVPALGIVGDALGTAIPLGFTAIAFLPRHMKKQIGVPVGTFLREAYTLPVLLTLPLVVALWLANRFLYPRNLVQLAAETLAASSIYGVGLLWAYRTNRVFHVAQIAAVTLSSGIEQPQVVVSVE
jgi:O-antigen/teichoic acid export membrane protein